MTLGAFVSYLELYLRFVNRGFRVPQMINSIRAGTAAYSRIKSLLAQHMIQQSKVWGENVY